MEEERKSFVMYNTYCTVYERLQKQSLEEATRFMNAIINYALRGKIPDEDDPVRNYLDTIFAQLDASSNRYELSKKGGRSSSKVTKEQIYEAMKNCSTWKEVAAQLNIDEKTLRKLRTEYEITDSKPGGQKTGKMGITSEAFFPDS